MLQCSFCNREILEVELADGRCPQCGSVLVWNEAGDEPAQPMRNALGDTLTTLDVSSEPIVEEFAAPVASEPQPAPVASKTEPPPEEPPDRDDDPGTVDDQKIYETLRPKKLSSDDKQVLKSKWGSTLHGAANARMTLKAGTPDYSAAVMRSVPRRGVQSPGDTADESADYQLIDVIGEGGVGIVYAARQPSVDRTVAVKMLRPDLAVEWGQRQKFLAEAVVTGDLDHPNIVPIHELGHRDDGALFYSMKRVSGTPWSDVVHRKSREENLDILMKVADAIAFAHSRGVVHRDLKPENVMLGEFGEVMVMDWGIAMPTVRFHRQDSLMQSGELGGTPAYMAPELATGPVEKIGAPADVYLLGGILYEIITGLTPHTGEDVMDCVEAAAANEIQSTEHSGELVNIALRAMATEPEDRYATVQEFQSAIREYLSHTESIALSTRAEEDLELAGKSGDYQDYARSLFAFQESFALWDGNHRAAMGISAAKVAYAKCAHDKGDYDLGVSLLDEDDPTHQRLLDKLRASQKERDARQQRLKNMRRTLGITAAAFVCAICIGLVAVWNAKNEAEVSRQVAVTNEEEAVKQRRLVKKKADDLKKSIEKVDKAHKKLEKQKKRADKEAIAAKRERDRAKTAQMREKIANLKTEYNRYLAGVSLIDEKIGDNAFEDARRMLTDLKSHGRDRWEWQRLNYLTNLALWELQPNAFVEAVAFSPNGSRFVSGDHNGQVRIHSNAIRSGELGRGIEFEHAKKVAVRAVAWSPDGRIVATAGDDGIIRLWNATDASPHQPHVLPMPAVERERKQETVDNTVNALKFSFGRSSRTTRGTRWLVASSANGAVVVWDLNTGTQAHPPLRMHSRGVWDVDVDPAQSRIVSAGDDGRIIIWNIDHDRRKNGDGVWIATTDGASVKPLEYADFHGDRVFSVAFSPDGRRIVSSGSDNRVLVWKPENAKPVDLKARVEGRRETSKMDLVLKSHSAPARCVRFSPDPAGRLILSASDDNTVVVWDAASGRKLHTLQGHGTWVRACAFAPQSLDFSHKSEGRVDATVLTGSYDKTVRLWRLSQANGELVFDQERNEVLDVAYDPKQNRVAVAREDGVVRMYKVPQRTRTTAAGWSIVRDLQEGHEFLATTAVFFKPDPKNGRRFLTGAMDGTVRLWNADTGTQIALLPNTGSSAAVALSPDEKWIATAGPNQEVLLWEVARLGRKSPRPIRLDGHRAGVVAVAFSPDGKTLVSGDSRGRCLVWDYRQRGAARPLNGNPLRNEHDRRLVGLAVGPNGKRVVTASTDASVIEWDITTGKALRTFRLPDAIVAFAQSPDGNLIAAAVATDSGRNAKSKDRAVLRLIDLTTGGFRDEIFQRTTISSLRFRPDGTRLLAVKRVAGREFPVVQEWKVDSVRMAMATAEVAREDVWTAAYAPDGPRVLTVGGRNARLWKSLDGEQSLIFGEHAAVQTVRFSPNGEFLVSGAADGWVKVWSTANSHSSQRLPVQHDGPVIASSFLAADGKQLCTVGGKSIAFWKYDAERGMWSADKTPLAVNVADVPKQQISAASFTRDGRFLAIVAGGTMVELWDLKERRPRGRFLAVQPPERHEKPVRCIRLSDDARWIVTGDDDSDAYIWEQTGGGEWQPIARLEGHTAPIRSVDVSADRQRVLTASEDRTAKLWDTRELVVGMPVEHDARLELIREDLFNDLGKIANRIAAPDATSRFAASESNRKIVERQLKTLGEFFDNGNAPALKEADQQAWRNATKARLLDLKQDVKDWKLPYKPEDTDEQKKEIYADQLKRWEMLVAPATALRRLVIGPDKISEIYTLRGHTRELTTIRFSDDGKAILTGGLDGVAILWPSLAHGKADNAKR